MGQALYRSYRPKRLDEVVGQTHIITTLSQAIAKGSISHAYLFTGPPGVGKTSVARILAHAVNDLDYNETTPALDIIEIDAASNRRIDEIRDLRSKVYIAPAHAKYKVYIIDEVHMLTREAFNALLKTLEEPPAHAIFILATTEVHKLPDTIISRTQRFTFKPINQAEIMAHLRHIATQEAIDITDEALALIAEHGEGSFRDSISLLDQISRSGQQIQASDLRASLGIAPQAIIEELYNNTFTGQPGEIIASLQTADQQGYEANHIAKQLSHYLRQKLIDGTLDQPLATTQLLKQLITVPSSANPLLFLEVLLLECSLNLNPQQANNPAVKHQPKVDRPKTVPQAQQALPDQKQPVASAEAPPIANQPTDKTLAQAWAATLDTLKQKHNTLYGVLRIAQPSLEGETITLTFQFAFHQKRVNETKNKQIIGQLLSQQLGQPISLNCTLQSDLTTPIPLANQDQPLANLATQAPSDGNHLSVISNIFGGAEVLE